MTILKNYSFKKPGGVSTGCWCFSWSLQSLPYIHLQTTKPSKRHHKKVSFIEKVLLPEGGFTAGEDSITITGELKSIPPHILEVIRYQHIYFIAARERVASYNAWLAAAEKEPYVDTSLIEGSFCEAEACFF